MTQTTTTKTITLQQLEYYDACCDYLDRFRDEFGDSVVVTEALAVKFAGQFDWDWARTYLLTGPASEAYDVVVRPAREAYRAVERQAREAYRAVERQASEAYDEAKARAFAAAYLAQDDDE